MDGKEMTPEEWEAKKAAFVSEYVGEELDRLDEAEADGVPFDEAEGDGSAGVAFADTDMEEFIGKYPMAGEVLGMLEKQEAEGEGGEGEGVEGKVELDGCTYAFSADGSWDDDEDEDDDDGDDE